MQLGSDSRTDEVEEAEDAEPLDGAVADAVVFTLEEAPLARAVVFFVGLVVVVDE